MQHRCKTVLWLCSITFPEAESLLSGKEKDFRSSGGWLVSLADALIHQDDVQLIVVSVDVAVKKCIQLRGEKILYYVLPSKKRSSYYESVLRIISDNHKPAAIHIHGTEHALGLHYLSACGNDNVIVSLQGIITEIAKHYYNGLSFWDIVKNITLRDILKGTIFHDKARFFKRGISEREILKRVTKVMGRTTFDKAFALSINKQIRYTYCSEVLRESFYTGSWSYEKCTPHTIFLSQSYYPVKGLHFVLAALPEVIEKFPDLTVRIAGFDFTYENGGVKGWIRRSGYGKIIKKMIEKLDLKGRIQFLGQLSAEEMKREFLRANLFICSSTCENSPNSLCEAQMLGTPSLASFVGGVPDTYIGARECLYQYDNIGLLAYLIIEILKMNNYDDYSISTKVKERHNLERIVRSIINIYEE